MQDQLEKIMEIGRKMGRTDEEIDREIAIGRKNAISGKMSAQMAVNQMIKDQDNNNAAKAVGQRLKDLREAKGMTVKETAEKAGIRPSTLTAIEEGRYNTGIQQIADIAHALGAHVEIVRNDSIDMFEIARKASEMRGLKVPEILPNTEDMEVKTIKLS